MSRTLAEAERHFALTLAYLYGRTEATAQELGTRSRVAVRCATELRDVSESLRATFEREARIFARFSASAGFRALNHRAELEAAGETWRP